MRPAVTASRSIAIASIASIAALGLLAQQPPGGRGGGGGGGGTTKLVEQFDTDKNGRLNSEERAAARASMANSGRGGRGGGRGGNLPPAQPGPKLAASDVQKIDAKVPLYDPFTLRTIFLEFKDKDSEWEKELTAFNNTDVEVPANIRIDGREYEDVGVHYRGASSFSTVPEGYKRSLNLSIDWVKKNQDVFSYKTLNLLNAHVDPTFLRTVLYMHIAREYLPAPKANYVRLVINGESWGIYINAQQFNKDFTKENFGTKDGSRWHAPGSPGGQSSLAYTGEDVAAYKRLYSIKTADETKPWADLINLTKVLNQTPPAQLVAALSPILDIDGALKFLAIDNALVNDDGYWIRASDYNIYEDDKGKFHIIPHDANETFREPEAPRGGGPPISGLELDPLRLANDPARPLASKLLAVPELRAKYLGYVRDIAEKWLDWSKLGPLAERYQAVIAADVAKDTRKLYPAPSFKDGLVQDVSTPGFGAGAIGLKRFADERRAYLLRVTAPSR